MPSQLLVRFPLLLAGLLIIMGGPSLIVFYTDWLWFGEIGYPQIFTTRLIAQITLFATVFLLTTVWLIVNFHVALSAFSKTQSVFTTGEGIKITLPGSKQMKTIASVIAIIAALLMGMYAVTQWLTWLSWRFAVPFGKVDPLLGHDISYYVFSLPFLQFARGLLQTLIVLSGLGAGALYLVSGSLTAGLSTKLSITPRARLHLSLLGAAFFLTLAVGAWLSRAELLLSTSGIVYGAAYADVHARLPVAAILTGIGILGAALTIFHGTSSRNWPIPIAIALFFLVSLGGEVYGSILQRFVVAPNEQTLETPFIEHNIEATREAFGLDAVDIQRLSGDASLTLKDIADNRPTLDNIRLWDHQPLLDTFGQIQEIRTYYDFVSVDNDRYHIDGEYRQVMLSARELNSSSLPNRTWVNERLTFTHGYGLAVGPVNEVTEEGLPVLFVQDLPPRSTVDLPVTDPSIYYGELSNDFVIVNSDTREFHYPEGDDNVFTQYDGRGGIPLDSFFDKLVFAMRFGSYQIVFSNDISAKSRILFNRNIRERVATLAPFLAFDGDPYLVVVDGRLMWIHDAYTVSGRYPYSTPATRGINYIRNTAKIVTDAYHGTTTVYLADNKDPIGQTYSNIFPNLFQPLDEMPQNLRAHVRYPEDLFALQSSVYATYHMTQPAVFYNREDQWEIPAIDEGGDARLMQPYYTIMRLPGEKEPEFMQMLPFTPRRKDNLAAWLVARSDGEHYGKLRVFEFPKQKLVFGPRQVIARISQDQEISPQITLWNQQGSQVIWGTLMVIPIEESLIYVRPLYLRSAGGRIPELTRVIVAYQNQIVMEETLDEALEQLFGGSVQRPIPSSNIEQLGNVQVSKSPQPSTVNETQQNQISGLASQATTHYQRAIEAQRAGDWATYGNELEQLGRILDQLQSQ